jgi:hypothetical protein
MPEDMLDELANRFTYHPPTPEQPEVFQLIRDQAHQLALLITHTTEPSRERSLALTALEEAVMHANSAIARHGLPPHAKGGAPELLLTCSRALRQAKPYSAVVAFCPAGWEHNAGPAQ